MFDVSVKMSGFYFERSGLLWLSILSQFPSEFVQSRSLELVLLITTTPSAGKTARCLLTEMSYIVVIADLA